MAGSSFASHSVLTGLLTLCSSCLAPVIAAIGLGLYGVGFSGVAGCFSLGLTQIAMLILFAL